MIYVKVNSANNVTYREIEGNTFDFYKIYVSYPKDDGDGPEGYSSRVQHFEIGIRTEVEKVEFKFDYCFAVLKKEEDKSRWFDSRPKKIGYIEFELYSPTGIVKVNKEGVAEYFKNEIYKKEKLFKKMEEINKRTTEMKHDFE